MFEGDRNGNRCLLPTDPATPTTNRLDASRPARPRPRLPPCRPAPVHRVRCGIVLAYTSTATAGFRPPTPPTPTTDRLDASRPARDLASASAPPTCTRFTEFAVVQQRLNGQPAALKLLLSSTS